VAVQQGFPATSPPLHATARTVRAGSELGRASLDDDLLRALRNAPDRSLAELADAVGLPRTNFGRPLASRVREPVRRLVDDGFVEDRGGVYRLSERGRRTLAERALAAEP